MSERKTGNGGRRGRRPMSDALFAELEASVREGKAILRGARKPARRGRLATRVGRTVKGRERAVTEDARGAPSVGALRARFQLSQTKFAALLGISTATLRNWEQGRRAPDGPARVLLRVAAKHPEAVLSAVVAAPIGGASARAR